MKLRKMDSHCYFDVLPWSAGVHIFHGSVSFDRVVERRVSERERERASFSSHTNLPTAAAAVGDDYQLPSWPSSFFFVELMMVIWGGSRSRTAARHILTWADICPGRRRRRVFTEANCYPPSASASAATNHDQVFITRFLRTGRA